MTRRSMPPGFKPLTGMNWQDVGPADLAGAPFTSFRVGFGLFQYTDGTMPAAEAIFDNLELWTSLLPVTRYVDVNSTNPTPPYTNWLTAATNIQDAVDAALAGDEIVVTNGTYATGGRAVGTNLLVNRVAVDKPLTVWSVNGPELTVINGDSTARCVYLSDGASLSGFTLTQGVADNGGGVRCASTNAFLAHFVIAGNSATFGGGAYGGTLYNCTLMDNSATDGGGAKAATLNNCTVVDNVAWDSGGGVASSTLANSIVAYNAAWTDPNYAASTLDYCCTSPLPTGGRGNITLPPQFVHYPNGNLRLQSNSACINAGHNAYVSSTTDLDGLPRIVSGTVDIGAYEFQGPSSVISYAWLQRYGLPTDGSADATDPDADGHTSWQEWRCQTDPTNPLSVLRLLSASPAGTNVTVTWQSVAGVNYFLERSTNLSATPPFTLLAPNLPGQPGTMTYTDTNATSLSPLFYRVGVGP
ncbi:MAG: hypothetical protein HY298_07990 [Verrucomicrobia bacterium]|nr:hypothetical protein [Verrucomicrobiota bacterium]